MAVPYTFASATTSIPLSELDANFATTITLGNTAIELGNTVTTLNNITLANVTISSGSVTITDVTASGNVTLSGGTANGVLYLNGSKVATSGSALTFDGTNLGVGTNSAAATIEAVGPNTTTVGSVRVSNSAKTGYVQVTTFGSAASAYGMWDANEGGLYAAGNINLMADSSGVIKFAAGGTGEAMRLTSTGLGIGTSSPNFLSWNKAETLNTASGNAAYELGIGDAAQAYFAADASNVYLAAYANKPLLIRTNNSTVATFDTSGNLGLGVTPSAWSVIKAIQIGSGYGSGIFADNGGTQVGISSNAYYSATGWKYFATAVASFYDQNSGQHRWYTAPSGTAGNAITFTQAMTLDASGNLGIGTSSVAAAGTTVHINGTSDASIRFTNSTSGTGVSNGFKLQANGTDAYLVNYSNGFMSFYTNGSESARIDSNGNLLLGTTDGTTGNKLVTTSTIGFVADSSIPQINYYSSASTIEYVNRNSGGSKTFSWYYQASGAGSPATLSTSGVWTNASDSRGKENIADLGYGLNTVVALKSRQFDVKSDGTHRIGFVAQELLAVLPEVVHVTMTDKQGEDWYGVDYGAITAVLAKAIQEQQAIIESLKARLDAANI